jgi:hypothetical protein
LASGDFSLYNVGEGRFIMAMRKTVEDGKTLNQRTADMLALWEFNSMTHFYVVQGSYNAGGVAQSAGTHDGGGAVDLSTYGLGTLADKKWHVKQGRLAGFAAYLRRTITGLWNEHIHAIAIADPEASAGARAQVKEYYAGGDALVGPAPDPDPRVHPIRVYPDVKLKKISYLVAYQQFRAKKPTKKMTVARIQWVLNEKLGTNLVCDGVAGKKTREAFKLWEKRIKAKRVDGVPGKYSLKELGKGRFVVSTVSYEKWRKAQDIRHVGANREKQVATFPKE